MYKMLNLKLKIKIFVQTQYLRFVFKMKPNKDGTFDLESVPSVKDAHL